MIFAYSRETSIDSQLWHSYLFSLAVLGTWGLWHGILFGHNRLFTYNTIQHDTTRYKIICYYMLLTKAGIEHPTPWTNPKFMTRSHRGFFLFLLRTMPDFVYFHGWSYHSFLYMNFIYDLSLFVLWSVCSVTLLNGRFQNERLGNGALTRYINLRVAHAPGMPGTFPLPPNSM